MAHDYNTVREKLVMPEYGRNIQKMVEDLKDIPDKAKRTEQAKAIVHTMELLNPSVHSEENWEHKLWDHLYVMADYDLDVDSPYPAPAREDKQLHPQQIPIPKNKIEAREYGRNIENVMKLIAFEPDGEQKTGLIRNLAIYMRQQYLIWNKNNVADETIFSDIERISRDLVGEAHMIHVPEGLSLTKIDEDANFSRPGLNLYGGQNRRGQQKRNFPRRKR